MSAGFCSTANRISGISYSGREDGRPSCGVSETWDPSELKHMSGVRHEESRSITELSSSCRNSRVLSVTSSSHEYSPSSLNVPCPTRRGAEGRIEALFLFLISKDPIPTATGNRCSYEHQFWKLSIKLFLEGNSCENATCLTYENEHRQ
jgi:hypothetical protein